MFDRYLRLARARKALQAERFEEVLQLVRDPLIAAEREAADLRHAAQDQLVARARRYLATGEWQLAGQVLAMLGPESRPAAAAEVEAAVQQAAVAARETQQRQREQVAEARAMLAAGRLDAVAELLAGCLPAGSPSADGAEEYRSLQHMLAERRQQVEAHLVAVGACLARCEPKAEPAATAALAEAFEQARRAVALDRDAGHDPRLQPLRAAAAACLAQRIAERLGRAEDGLPAALAAYREVTGQWPGLAADPQVDAAAQPLRTAAETALRRAADWRSAQAIAGGLAEAGLLLREPAQELCTGLLAMEQFAATGGAEPLAAVHAAAVACGAKLVAATLEQELSREQWRSDQIAAARVRLASGEFEQARELLAAVLNEQPWHDAARRDYDLVAAGLQELQQRLQQAREAASAGRLRSAAAVAAGIAPGGRLGGEAQVLLAELQARMAVVDRGLDEVRAALHGRGAATANGLGHSLQRLQQLAKVQTDHPDLPGLLAAVTAELEALTVWERLQARLGGALAAGGAGHAALAEDFHELLRLRDRLLLPVRLDARVLEIADAVSNRASGALASGDLAEVERLGGLLAAAAVVRPEFAQRAAVLQQQASHQREQALAAVTAARTAGAAQDLAAAEAAAEAAARLWADGAEVRELQRELAAQRQHAAQLDRIASLTAGKDLRAAARQLEALAPAAPLLRTRIYDMKASLAKAQGLEGAFLLRIDEGGEHLVLRTETVVIGNVQKRVADLPILASLAGRHASIRRSMSFHGGMQDRIVAEDGTIQHDGKPIAERRLQHGDRIALTTALSLRYTQPCRRSLTTALQLQGGFQVAGTDRLLLLKDRGRDGRILIGPGQDVHVKLGGATGEVEVFAAPSGQVQVAAASGTIDGRPFRGEHPVAAGELVVACGVSFVLLPWHPHG